MSSPPNWFFSVCSFIGFVFVTIPLPWHLEAWNTGTCLYMIWTGLGCLILFINSIVWNSDVINKAPVWCDISTKFMVGLAVAIPSTSLCINRRLYHIVSVDIVTKTRAQKRRDVLGDLAISLGIPVLEIILHYIVQDHRFKIVEEIGCYPSFSDTIPAYALVFALPIVIGLVSATYCIRTIRKLVVQRTQLEDFLSAHRGITSGHYFRLMGLAGMDIVFTIPLGAFIIYLNASRTPIQQWVSWANIHSDFQLIEQFPSVVWHQDQLTVAGIELTRYTVVFCAFLFFAFFGFADEARRNYRIVYTSFTRGVGLSTERDFSGTYSGAGSRPEMFSDGLPVFITHRTECEGDSMASFSCPSIGEFSSFDATKKKQPHLPTSSEASISREMVPDPNSDIAFPTLPLPTLDISAVPSHFSAAPHFRRSSIFT